MSGAKEFGRLSASFIAQMNADTRNRPKQTAFFRFLRETLGNSGSEQYWRALVEGEIVEWKYVEAFHAWWQQEKDKTIDLAAMTERVQEPSVPLLDPREPDLFSTDWTAAARVITSAFAIAPEAYCRTDADFHLAAKILLTSAGRKVSPSGGSTSDEIALPKGEDCLKHSFSTYANWLKSLAAKDAHCRRPVMFAVADGDTRNGPNRRVGVTVVLPLTERAYKKMRNGLMGEPELTPDDIQIPSRYLYLGNFAEVKPAEYKNRKRLTIAQFHTCLYQAATLCPLLMRKRSSPTLFSSPPHEEGVRRCEKFGFRSIDIRDPIKKSLIRELVPSCSSGSYILMYGLLCMYQIRHHAQRPPLDD